MIAYGLRWNMVTGPVSATLATCERLGWEMPSATVMLTHEGKTIDLEVDPPPVVEAEVVRAVQQWRWKRVERAFPQLGRGCGRQSRGEMRPIWQVLSSKTKAGRWDHGHKAAYKSVFAGRQWTQSRRKKAKLAEHDKCVVCFANSCREHRLPWPPQHS